MSLHTSESDPELLVELAYEKDLKQMRTDWLLLEKERLERENADPMDIDVIESELKRRKPLDRERDNVNVALIKGQ